MHNVAISVSPTHLASIGLLFLLVGAGSFLRQAVRGTVPPGQHFLRATASLAGLCAVAALVQRSVQPGPWLPVAALAMLPLLLGPAFVVLVSLRHVPLGGIAVGEGDPMLPFRALCPSGAEFNSDSLRGQRILLKFFRGQWCPFCAVELRQFEAMRPDLRQYGVQVVALSKDTPAAASYHRQRDDLGFTLLCDPKLEVIRAYGLEHRRALEVSSGKLTLFGLPLGLRPRFKTMAAPTTLLIDEDGVVRWIDQTDDYKIRGNKSHVLSAIQKAFGKPETSSVPASLPDTVRPPIEEPLCS